MLEALIHLRLGGLGSIPSFELRRNRTAPKRARPETQLCLAPSSLKQVLAWTASSLGSK